MLDVCCVPTSYDEYIAIVTTGNECQLSDYMLFVSNLATAVCACKCCSSQVSLCHSTHCLVCCMRNGARSVPRNLTRHRLERVLTRHVDTHPWSAVCIIQAKRVLHTIHVLSLSHPCVALARVARTTHVVFWVHTSHRRQKNWWKQCVEEYADIIEKKEG